MYLRHIKNKIQKEYNLYDTENDQNLKPDKKMTSENKKFFCKFCNTLIRCSKLQKKLQCIQCLCFFHKICNLKENKTGKDKNKLKDFCISCLEK